MTQRTRVPAPSVLARKILCPAYSPAPLSESDRCRLQGLHAVAILEVVRRHLKAGYILKQVEYFLGGGRVDLLFQDHCDKIRLDEVKSSKKIREVHKIQAALYANSFVDEIVVSTSNEDQVLTPQFIEETRERAVSTLRLLSMEPNSAEKTYRPHEDTCYTCGNVSCPFLSQTSSG